MNFVTRSIFELQETTLMTARAVSGLFRGPRYLAEAVNQMDVIGVGSLTIILLTGFFTGGVLTLQTFPTLAAYSAQGQTGKLVAISLIRELGPVLTVVADVVGIGGGGIAATTLYGLSINAFVTSVRDGITADDVIGGVIKPVCFAVIIASVACYKGLTTEGGTVGVGRSTTRAVVTASIVVIVADFFLARALQYLLGMPN